MVVTDFLRKKWLRLFEAADVNKNGIITLDDANLFTQRFSMHHKMDKARTDRLRSEFQKTWKSLLLFERSSLKPADFLKEMEASYNRDKTKFRERMFILQQDLINIFDVNEDGKLSEKEFVVVQDCWGMKELDRSFVGKFPQSPKGFIQKDAWRDAWVNFYCNDDANKIKEERPLLECLGLL